MIKGGERAAVVRWSLRSLWFRQRCQYSEYQSQHSTAAGRDCSVRHHTIVIYWKTSKSCSFQAVEIL